MRFIFYLILMTIAVPCKSQNISFNHINVEHGLSQNSIFAITQDQDGFIWFGTSYGLNRYDGRTFHVYHKGVAGQGLGSDYILSLYNDSKNNLWIGTQNGLDLYYLDSDSITHIALKHGQSPSVQCITGTKNREIWIGQENQLLYSKNTDPKTFFQIAKFKGRILAIFEHSSGRIFIGTTQGLYVTDQRKKVTKASISKVADTYISSLTEDHNHRLWAGTGSEGIFSIDLINQQITAYKHQDQNPKSLISNTVRKILFDKKGSLWVATLDGLSVKLSNADDFRNYQHDDDVKTSLSQNSVHSIFEDQQGSIWAGTFFGGVNYANTYQTPFKDHLNGKKWFQGNAISTILEDDDFDLWIGTEGRGIGIVDVKTGKVTPVTYQPVPGNKGLSSNLVKVLYKDTDGNIWIGTHGGGLNVTNKSLSFFKRYLYEEKNLHFEITSINEDENGTLWLGTQEGLKAFKRKGTELFQDTRIRKNLKSLAGHMVLSIFRDVKKQLWFGTDDALYLLRKDNFIKIYGHTGTEKPFRVNCMNEDNSGHIWVGTYYNGIYCFNNNGERRAFYSSKDGLADNNIVGILPDKKGNLWISTGNGLSKFNTSGKSFNNYFVIDGIAGNVFNTNSFFKSHNGTFYFGGYNGLTIFNPDEIQENNLTPRTILSGLWLFGKPVKVGDETGLLAEALKFTKTLTFNYRQNSFSIQLSSNNYIQSSKNRYAYILEGKDMTWELTDNPVIYFNDLSPSTYRLVVKSSNNDGKWSPPVSIGIKVLPPFWKSWQAYLLYTLAFLLLTFFVVRFFFMREWVKRTDELTQLKLNFFTNISHEIRTHLSLIIGPVNNILSSHKHKEGMIDQLNVIKSNSESLLQLVNELMDFRKAESGHLQLSVAEWDIVTTVKDIMRFFNQTILEKNIILEVIAAQETVYAWFDKAQMTKVFENILANALKFSSSGGKITVTIDDLETGIEIKINDQGKGISKESLKKLFDSFYQESDHNALYGGHGLGLPLAKSIVELHGGSISAVSEAKSTTSSGYTSFMIKLLKGKNHFSEAVILEDANRSTKTIHHATTEYILASSPPETELLIPPADQIKVLLVEDNREIRNFIVSSLKEKYTFIECENGLQGWNSAVEVLPDMIISDVMMPGMDGMTLSRQLKADQRTSHIPIILLTAKAEVDAQISGLSTGADYYLSKPFNIRILELTIANLLAARIKLWQYFKDQNVQALKSDAAFVIEQVHAPALHPLDLKLLNKAREIIKENMSDQGFGITQLSAQLGMSQPVLLKKIKAVTGLSTHDFVKSIRLLSAGELLKTKQYTVYEVSFLVGYDDSKYFSKEFKKYFGQLPTEFIKEDQQGSATEG